ncbi:hypothetical protein ABT364_06410 [Massilia sp. SR12]
MTEEPERPPAPAAPPVAMPPLGAWRVPLFWMGCGALLASLAGGAVLVAQRIGLERDMAAVATLVAPPSVPAESSASAAPAAAPAVTLPAATPATPALPAPPAQTGKEASTPPPLAMGAPTAPKARLDRVPGDKRVKAKRPGSASKATRYAVQAGKKAAKPRTYRSQAAGEKALYWGVFKRCPLPGEPGAVECRRHICHGAEKKGPACKPYRGKWR